jgi:predicted nucleic acid-binding protein
MILALDTSGYSQFAVGVEAAVAAMEAAESLAISTVVLGELFAGFRRGTREKANRKRLDEFVDAFAVRILPLTIVEANWYATVIERLRATGRPIPTNDAWIAAAALAAGAGLLTADRHFDVVAGLKVIKLPVEIS